MKTLARTLAAVLSIALSAVTQGAVKNVVLVHGAFADGSGWKPVAQILKHDGYTVYVVQEPETTFEADVAATRLVLDRSGPCVLVGHSYGGMIITEAGVHPAVKSLVYVAAFQPVIGESAASLNSRIPAAGNSIVPIGDGFVQVKRARLHLLYPGTGVAQDESSGSWMTVDVDLEQRSRVVGRPPRVCWLGTLKAQGLKVEFINERIDRSHRVVSGDPVV
jgi:pimeloyl-ACP methyl ester carboxylesterase